jgi:dihydrofolate synthase/folylpolyglutamate synthase
MSTIEQAYHEALSYLNRFIDYEKGMPYSYSPAVFNLARTAHLLEGLEQPQNRYPSLLIAGTKGKGSTAAFLERILRAAGQRTGLYISPHLHTWRERVQIDRELISQQEVVDWIERLRPLVEKMSATEEQGPPTYYEISTALALGYFAEQKIDVAVLEVGLGGRLDATNVVTPRISILTTIGYDHMAILGDTLSAIAGEKAAIVKPGGWAVSAPQEAEAMAVIERNCQEQSARLWVAELSGARQTLPEPAGPWPYPATIQEGDLSLRGAFQRTNARVAVTAVLALREQGWDIPSAAIQEGLGSTQWPGRLEVVGQHPTIVLDGAHNLDSARVLRQALRDEFSFDRLILVMGFSQGHDVAAFAREIGTEASHIVTTASRHPRAARADEVSETVRRAVKTSVEQVEDVAAALDRATQLALPQDLVCVCGSLFVVAEVREARSLAQETDRLEP